MLWFHQKITAVNEDLGFFPLCVFSMPLGHNSQISDHTIIFTFQKFSFYERVANPHSLSIDQETQIWILDVNWLLSPPFCLAQKSDLFWKVKCFYNFKLHVTYYKTWFLAKLLERINLQHKYIYTTELQHAVIYLLWKDNSFILK